MFLVASPFGKVLVAEYTTNKQIWLFALICYKFMILLSGSIRIGILRQDMTRLDIALLRNLPVDLSYY